MGVDVDWIAWNWDYFRASGTVSLEGVCGEWEVSGFRGPEEGD